MPCVKGWEKDLSVTLSKLYSVDLFLLECVEFCLNRNNLFHIISCLRFVNIVNRIARLFLIHIGVNKILRVLKFFVHIFIIIQ